MRHLLHKAICWYLLRCAGAFHCYNYGETGRYVVLMTDEQYHIHQRMQNAELSHAAGDRDVAIWIKKPEAPKISVWWLAVILFVSMALSALLTALGVWLKR